MLQPPAFAPSPLRALAGGRHARLRAATAELHADAEAVVAAQGFFASRTGYAEFLRRSLRFYAAFEPWAEAAGAGRLLTDWPSRRRLPLLQADCVALGIPLPPTMALDRQPAIGGPAGLLGALYVSEGSTLGARFLAAQAAALGVSMQHGASFLHAHAGVRGTRWRAFLAVLEDTPLDDQGEEDLLAAAVATFRAYAAVIASTSGLLVVSGSSISQESPLSE